MSTDKVLDKFFVKVLSCDVFSQKTNFWPKFWFLTKILIFDQYLNFWLKFEFLTKIRILPKFEFGIKFEFLTKIWTFAQHFECSTYCIPYSIVRSTFNLHLTIMGSLVLQQCQKILINLDWKVLINHAEIKIQYFKINK